MFLPFCCFVQIFPDSTVCGTHLTKFLIDEVVNGDTGWTARHWETHNHVERCPDLMAIHEVVGKVPRGLVDGSSVRGYSIRQVDIPIPLILCHHFAKD